MQRILPKLILYFYIIRIKHMESNFFFPFSVFFSRVPYLLSKLSGAVAVRDSCEGHARGHVFKHLSYQRNDSLFTWLNLHHFYFSFTYSGFVNRTLKGIPCLKFDSCYYISTVTKLSLIISYIISYYHSVHQVVFLIGSQKFQ